MYCLWVLKSHKTQDSTFAESYIKQRGDLLKNNSFEEYIQPQLYILDWPHAGFLSWFLPF